MIDKGVFYGVGVGPSDPELVTVKAIKILNSVDVVICPIKNIGEDSFAYSIVKEHIRKDMSILEMVFPMNYKKDELMNKWEANAQRIAEMIHQGKNVAFITLGDPMVYSTYAYLLPYLKELEVEYETISGITSFCLTASRVGVPIVEWNEGFCVVPLRKGVNERVTNALDNFDNIVIMKPSKDCKGLAREIIKRGLEKNMAIVSKAGTKDEAIIRDIKVLMNEEIPYFSTLIIKKSYTFEE